MAEKRKNLYFDSTFIRDPTYFFDEGDDRAFAYLPRAWPTRHELREFNAPGAADSVLQIVRRDAVYRGLAEYRKPRSEYQAWYNMKSIDEGGNDVSLHALIANGGKILVVGSHFNKQWESFRDHPQLVFWNGDRGEVARHLKNHDNFPVNTKGVIISKFLSHAEGGKVIEEARRRRALIMNGKTDGEVTRLLEEITERENPVPDFTPLQPHPQLAVGETDKKPEPPGPALRRWHKNEQLQFTEQHHKAEGITAEEGRRLAALAQEQGIQTTDGSMQQAVRQFRMQYGIIIGPKATANQARKATKKAPVLSEPAYRDVPTKRTAPVAVADNFSTVLKMIDDLMSGFALLRDEVAGMQKQSARFEKIKQLLNE